MNERERLFIPVLSSTLFTIWGTLFGAVFFEKIPFDSISHNLAHFITFWCVFASGWAGYLIVKKTLKIYSMSSNGQKIQHMSFVFLGALLWVTGKLLFIVFIA